MEKWSNWNGQIDGIDGMFFLLRCFSFCFQQRSLKNCLPFAFAIRNAPIQSDGKMIESGIFFVKKKLDDLEILSLGEPSPD
jgi:hypothetical protein